MRYTQIYLDSYDAICSYLDIFKLSSGMHGKCDTFTFINFCADALGANFQTPETLSKLNTFYEVFSLAQSQSQGIK